MRAQSVGMSMFHSPFYFIIRYMPLPYGGLFADWRVLPPISGCLGCTIRSCKYVCNTIRHRSVKNHRSNPFYISWTCLTVRPAFERYLKLRKIFHNSKSAQIPTGVVNLVSYCVYDVDVSIVATSVTLEHWYQHRCKRYGCTPTPISFA